MAAAPSASEIKVRIHAAPLNFRDGLVVNGFSPAKDGLIPLSDVVGEVVAVGAGVSGFALGMRSSARSPQVAQRAHGASRARQHAGGPADGFACQEVTRPATHFTKARGNLSYVEGGNTDLRRCHRLACGRDRRKVQPGERVLIQGTDGVSLFALQFAKAAGATLIATSSFADKLARPRELGADHVINHVEVLEWR